MDKTSIIHIYPTHIQVELIPYTNTMDMDLGKDSGPNGNLMCVCRYSNSKIQAGNDIFIFLYMSHLTFSPKIQAIIFFFK